MGLVWIVLGISLRISCAFFSKRDVRFLTRFERVPNFGSHQSSHHLDDVMVLPSVSSVEAVQRSNTHSRCDVVIGVMLSNESIGEIANNKGK